MVKVKFDTILDEIRESDVIAGAWNIKGNWNASTNTPTLVSGVGTSGDLYIVNVAGSTNLDGETNWNVGDEVYFDGTTWQKVGGVALWSRDTTGTPFLKPVNAGDELEFDGNLRIEKVDPESRLIDTGNSEYTRVTKSDTDNKALRRNRISWNSVDSQTKLLLHCDGSDGGTTFTDSSASAHTVTPTDTTTESAQFKFGTASAEFTGTGGNRNRLSIPNSTDFDFTGSDFTIDLWVRPTNAGDTDVIFNKGSSTTADLWLQVLTVSGNFAFYASSDGSTWDIASNVTMGAYSAATWHHIAITRSGSNWYLFVDGVLSGNEFTDATELDVNTETLKFGSHLNGIEFTGYMDEIRVSKGVARWTTGFTPPTSAYGITTEEVEVWDAIDGSDPGDKGIITFGDDASKTMLDGRTIRFNIAGAEQAQIDENGNFNVKNGNSLFVSDGTNVDNVELSHDGTTGIINANTAIMRFGSGDAGDYRRSEFRGDGTSNHDVFILNNTNFSSMRLAKFNNNGHISTTTGFIEIQPFTGETRFSLPGTDSLLTVYDAAETNNLSITHNGTNGIISTNAGDLNVSPTGIFKYSAHPTFTTDEQITDKKYVDDNFLNVNDDGTNYEIRLGTEILFKIRKSDHQLLLDSGSDDDAF